MIARLLYLVSLIFLLGCASKKEVIQVEEIAPRPSWVSGKPISNGHYSGIGMAYKTNGADYITMAKNNALNDLASEISVNISSSSLFYQIEQDDNLREEFQANTRLKSKENLEGYELVGTYENDKEYWVYYSLSKAEYQQIKIERQNRAIALSTQLFQNAREFKANIQYAESIKFNIKAIAALKDYMADPLQTEIDGKQVFLHVELYTYLQQTLSDIELRAINTTIQAKRGNAIPAELLKFNCTSESGISLAGVPIYIYYSGGRIQNNQLYTNGQGNISYTLQKVTSTNQREYFQANLNMIALVSEATEDPFIRKLLAKLSGPEARVEINIQNSKVYINSTELNLGNPMATRLLANAYKASFFEEGFKLSDDQKDADYILVIRADTRKFEQKEKFVTSALDVVVKLLDAKENLLYEKTIQSFLGMQLTPEKAGEDAYKKLAKEIQKRYFREMRRKVFD